MISLNILNPHQKLFDLDDTLKHLEASSNVITMTHPVKFNLEKSVSSIENHERAINVVTRIIDFIVSFAGSRCSALSKYLLNNDLIHSIMDIRALLVACENRYPYQTQVLQEVIIK